MTREIKFRQYIWDTDDKSDGRMVGWEDLLSESGESLSCTFSTKFSNASDLMQFTGLHDKDGVEVYEGDVVRTIHGTYVVKWITEECWVNLCGFHLCDSHGGHMSLCKTFIYTMKVIGNICENPELLSGESS